MKVYRVDAPGSLEGLVRHEEPEPTPGFREVLIRLRAVSLNVRDLNVICAQYVHAIRPGLVPVSDGSGEVVAIGEGVTRVKVGDRVSPIVLQRWIAGERLPQYSGSGLGGSLDGLLREFAVVHEEGLVHIPSYLTFEEAATFGLAGVSAWASLKGGPPLRPDQTVLVQGTGGVSIFALQLAKLFGARVIALTSTQQKIDLVKRLGADEVVNYKAVAEWDAPVRELTGGRGVDRVVDVLGPSTIEKSVKSLAIGGHLSLLGALGGTIGNFNPLLIVGKAITIEGIGGGSRRDFEQMLMAMEQHKLHPVIDRAFPFDQTKAALGYLQQRLHVGKVVITL